MLSRLLEKLPECETALQSTETSLESSAWLADWLILQLMDAIQ